MFLAYSKGNKVFVDSMNDAIVKVEIIDILGRTVIFDKNIDASSKTYEVSNANTILFVIIELGSGIKVVKKVLL